MANLVSYSYRNLWTRRLTTILTASGMALVVFVFAAVLMMAAGLRETLVQTGSYDNVVVIRKGSQSEVQSGIDRNQAAIIETQPEVAIAQNGQPLLAKEMVVLIELPKRGTTKPANVVIRGGAVLIQAPAAGNPGFGPHAQTRLSGSPGGIERCKAIHGCGHRRVAPIRHAELDCGRHIRRRRHCLQLGDLG